MRKLLKILLIVILIALAGFAGWYFFMRDTSVPLGEAVINALPFGSWQDTTPPLTTNDGSNPLNPNTEATTTDVLVNPGANLFQISTEPISGSVSFKKGSETILRYVDRATGHIYDVNLGTLVKSKVTNQTLPKIYEAYFRADGNAVLLRSLKDDTDVVDNTFLTLTPPTNASTTLYSIASTPLRGEVSSVAVGSGPNIYYALKDSSSIVSSNFTATAAKTLLTNPFTNWRLAVSGASLLIYTKASFNVPGYAYTLGTSNGAFKKILGPLNGLTAITNTAGNKVLYSYVDNNKTKLMAQSLTNKDSSEISPATLAEKCLWSTKNVNIVYCAVPTDGVGLGQPDNWYRGATHYSDRLWLFDTSIDIAQVLVEPKPTLDVDIDAIDLKLSPDEDYLIFTNKNDLSLWVLKLEKL